METINFTKVKSCHIEVLLKFEDENVEEENVYQVAHFKLLDRHCLVYQVAHLT